MTFLNLDSQQLKAVCRKPNSRSVIIAGAGSGKTAVLSSRAIFTRLNVDPNKVIICISFTTMAATELGSRIRRTMHTCAVQRALKKVGLDKPGSHQGFWTGTLHSFALDMLRDLIDDLWHEIPEEEQKALDAISPGLYSNLIGKDLNGAILQEEGSLELWNQIRDKLMAVGDLPPKLSRLHRQMGPAKAVWMSRACALEEGRSIPDPLTENQIKNNPELLQEEFAILESEAMIATAHYLMKRDLGKLDFDDILILAGLLLRNSPTIQLAWKKHLGHLLNDECQDMSAVDWFFLSSLPDFDPKTGNEPEVGYTLIADPKQSIFGFRSGTTKDGAFYDLLQKKTWYQYLTPLVINYRSGSSIVTLSQMISQNKGLGMDYEKDSGFQAKSHPKNGKGQVAWHVVGKNHSIDRTILILVENLTEGSRAILTPTNAQCDYIRELLAKNEFEGFEVYTIHSAKGREWDHVIVTGLGAGRFPAAPSPWSTKEDNLRNESRLLYVAISRGKKSTQVIEPESGEFYPTLNLQKA